MTDPKEIVAHGYNQIADIHAEWAMRTRSEERARYANILLERLPDSATLLELGCGVGFPTTVLLAQRFRVTGVDISARHIVMASERIPHATFIHADMTQLTFPPEHFDAVAAFYSLIHVPRDEQPALLSAIARWLRPGGLLVASMGARSEVGSIEDNWLGAPMYWSHFDSVTNQRLVQAVGLDILSAVEETDTEDGEMVTFLWVVAQKPMAGQRIDR